MFNKTIFSLLVLSMLHTNVAFCMKDANSDDEDPKSPPLKHSSKIEEDVSTLSQTLNLEKYQSLSKEDFITEFLKENYLVYSLDEEKRTELDLLIYPFLEDKNISLRNRCELLLKLRKAPPVETFKNLLKDIKDQSIELEDHRISLLINLSENNPIIIKKIKALLKTPKQSVSFIDSLFYDSRAPVSATAQIYDLILELAKDDSQPQEVRVVASKKVTYFVEILDEEQRAELDSFFHHCLDDMNLSLSDRLVLLRCLKKAPPAETLKNLLKEITEESFELRGHQLDTFIRHAESDPVILEHVKGLLKTLEQKLEFILVLNGQSYTLILEMAKDDSQPQEVRMAALRQMTCFVHNTQDEERRPELDLLIHSFLEDKKSSLSDRLELFVCLKKAPPVETLKKLLQETTEQSFELGGNHLATFIRLAESDPVIREKVKGLLKTPVQTLEFVNNLPSNDASTNALLLKLAKDESQPQEVRVAALKRIIYSLHLMDGNEREELDRLVLPFFDNLDNRALSLKDYVGLLCVLKKAPPTEALKSLLKDIRDQSFELEHYQIAAFIRCAEDDPFILENAKALLNSPKMVVEVAVYLTNDKMAPLVDLILAVARDESQPQETRVGALRQIKWPDIKIEEESRKERDRLIISLRENEKLSLKERIEFLDVLKEALPVETLIKLAEALEPENASKVIAEGGKLEPLLDRLTESSHPIIKEKLERYFFTNPKNFLTSYKEWIIERLQEVEDSKKELILEAIFKCIQPKPKSIKLKFAHFILRYSDNKKYIDKTTDVLYYIIMTDDPKKYKEKSAACSLILKYSEDPERKKFTIQWLFDVLGKEISLDNVKEQLWYLEPLLKQTDPEIRRKSLELCNVLVSHTLAKNQEWQDVLVGIYNLLKNIEGSEGLQEKILTLLKPRLEEILSSQAELKFNLKLTYLLAFLRSSDERSRQRAYDHFKTIIIEEKEDKATQAATVFIYYQGEEHPWSEEVTRLMVARENIDSKNNSFVAYRDLLKKVKEPVVHKLSATPLSDGKKVRFSLKSLQTPRREKLSTVEPGELVRLTQKLIEEMKKNEGEVSALVGTCKPGSLIKTAESPFLKGMLLNDSPQNTGIRFKLHRILREAKNREGELPSKGLSPTSRLMLQLLVNVKTCPTGKEDGVDVTYRLIDNQRGASEEDLKIERAQEKSKETILEELRQIREGLLNGEGPVVRHFIKDEKIKEPPHQAKYLRNLLLGQIGTHFEGEILSYDLNGGEADERLRKASLQDVLDVFYSHYRPEKVIERLLKSFNTNRLPGTFITSVIGAKRVSDNYEFYFDIEDDKWKAAAIVELLLRLGILEEVH